jgi:DNA polymerase/3'-5' exonuclease PolX
VSPSGVSQRRATRKTDFESLREELVEAKTRYGSVTLMWATGPKGHTIGMTIKAEKKGLLFNPKGIWTRTDPPKLIGGRSEEEIASLLGWKYKPPELRGHRKAQF